MYTNMIAAEIRHDDTMGKKGDPLAMEAGELAEQSHAAAQQTRVALQNKAAKSLEASWQAGGMAMVT